MAQYKIIMSIEDMRTIVGPKRTARDAWSVNGRYGEPVIFCIGEGTYEARFRRGFFGIYMSVDDSVSRETVDEMGSILSQRLKRPVAVSV